jgi:hypothetical protein
MRPNLFSRSATIAVAVGLVLLLGIVVATLGPVAIERWQ